LAGSNETLARSVASFTDASTPSSLFSRRSIRPAQTAHVIPPTSMSTSSGVTGAHAATS